MDREKLIMLIALSYFHLKRSIVNRRKAKVMHRVIKVLDPWILIGRMEVVESV